MISLNHLKSKAVFVCKILSAKCVISFQGRGGYAHEKVVYVYLGNLGIDFLKERNHGAAQHFLTAK